MSGAWVYVVFVCCAMFFFGSLWLTKSNVPFSSITASSIFPSKHSSTQEFLPVRTSRAFEQSSLYKQYKWQKYSRLKGYSFYLDPEMGYLVSLQLAPNGRITVFRMNSLEKEPALPAKLAVMWFACDFIYGNEACTYTPLIGEFATEIEDHSNVHYSDINSFPIMDVHVGFFQSPALEFSGVECRAQNARPWRGASAVKSFIGEANRKITEGPKLQVPQTYLKRHLAFPKERSDLKEIADTEEAIYDKFEHAVRYGDVTKARSSIDEMDKFGRHERADDMRGILDWLMEHYPGCLKEK